MPLRIIAALLIILTIAGGYIYWTGGAGLPERITAQLSFLPARSDTTTAIELPEQISQLPASLPENTSQQLQTVSQRTGELTSTVGQVLGESIKVASSSGEKTLQEKAFDYGRYLYCQQVVKEYEARTKNAE